MGSERNIMTTSKPNKKPKIHTVHVARSYGVKGLLLIPVVIAGILAFCMALVPVTRPVDAGELLVALVLLTLARIIQEW